MWSTCGDLVGGYTHKQRIVVASLIKAESFVLFDACKDDLSLYYFPGEYMVALTSITMYMDNLEAMFTVRDVVTDERS